MKASSIILSILTFNPRIHDNSAGGREDAADMTIHRNIHSMWGHDYFQGGLPIYVNRAVESYDLAEHNHDFLEISYVCEGVGTHHSGPSAQPVAQGDIFVIPVGVSHVFRPASPSLKQPLVVYNCVVSMEAVARLLEFFPGGDGLGVPLTLREYRRYQERTGEFQRIFQKLHLEFTLRRPGREAALYVHLLELLLFLQRLDAGAEPSSHAAAPSSTASDIEKVIDCIHTRYDQPLTVRELAELAGIGERQLHRLFKKHTGTTLTSYIQNVRIQEACRLLRTTSRKVSDIAASVGYQHLTFFNSLFKAKTGHSPRDYRRSSRL